MRDILLIGGMRSGKSTLAGALIREEPKLNYVYMSTYNVRIPMTLIATTLPGLLNCSKEEYIDTILNNKSVNLIGSSRREMDEFGEKVLDLYSDTLFAEIGLGVARKDVSNILDNIPKVSNVRYLKERGVYVVALKCGFETQVKRGGKDIDPKDKSSLELQIQQTNRYFEVEETRKLADIVIDTENMQPLYSNIAKKILQEIR